MNLKKISKTPLCILLSLTFATVIFSTPTHASDYGNAEIPEILDLNVKIDLFGRTLRAESTIKIRRSTNALKYLSINYDTYLPDGVNNILKKPCATSHTNLNFTYITDGRSLVSSEKSGDWIVETFKGFSLKAPEPGDLSFCPAELIAKSVWIVDETGVQRMTRIEKICISGCKKIGIDSIWPGGGSKVDLVDHRTGKWSSAIVSPLWTASPTTAKCKEILSAKDNKYIGQIAVYEGCNQVIDFNSLNFDLTETKIQEGELFQQKMFENKKYFDNFVQTEFRDYNFKIQEVMKYSPKLYGSKIKPLDIEIKTYFNKFATSMSIGGATNPNLIEFKGKLAIVLGIIQKESKTKINEKMTITCVKGNVTKKVAGTKPKCPSGYVQK